MKIAKQSVPARIVLVAPPKGVIFALQRGRHDLGSATVSEGKDLEFEFSFLVQPGVDGSPRFSGEYVQGPAGGKFVYCNSGTLAGQTVSGWTRRAKIGLQTLSWATLERVASEPGRFLQARIAGTGRDGGPACATVPLLDGGWLEVEARNQRKARGV